MGEEGQRLGQREAVDAEPEAVVDLGAGDRLAGLGLDALGGGGDEVRPEHLLQRPAGQQILRGVGGEVGEPRAHGVDLVAHHGVEALALGGLQVGIVEHVEGGPHAGERCPARLGQLDQPVVAARLGGIVVGDVVEEQHVAAEGGVPFAGPHRRQADLEEVAGRRGGDELRGRGGLAAGDAALDGFAGVVDQGAVDHRVDRPAEADQLGAAGAVGGAREPAEEGAGAAVVEQDPPVEVADDDALVQLGHQRPELVALERHLAAGVFDQPRHVGAKRPPLVGEPVDGLGQGANGVAAGGGERGRRRVVDEEPGRICEPRRRRDERLVEPADRPGAERGRREPPSEHQRAVARDERGKRRTLARGRASRGARARRAPARRPRAAPGASSASARRRSKLTPAFPGPSPPDPGWRRAWSHRRRRRRRGRGRRRSRAPSP